MSNYIQTEVGLIPEDWEVEFVKNLATIKTGSKNTQDRIENGAYPFFVRSQIVERINSYSFDGEAVLTAGDGVGVGKVVHYINGKFDCHQRVYRISDFSKKLNGYFFYLYFSNNFLNRIMQMTAKSSVDSVRMDMIANMPIPIPPTLQEQTAIATALSNTDALIASLEKLIAKKRNIKQGAMQELLRPKEGWEVKKYGEVFDFLSTANFSRAELTTNDLVKYVHYGDIHTKWSNFLDVSKNTLPSILNEQIRNFDFLREGDIIMADASEDYLGIGKSVEVRNIRSVKAISGLHTFLLRDKKDVFMDGFKGYIHVNVFVKKQLDRLATGLKVYSVSKTILKTVDIPIPPKQEQIRIKYILSEMDTELTAFETKLSKYKQIKQGMMQNLLTGKIRLV